MKKYWCFIVLAIILIIIILANTVAKDDNDSSIALKNYLIDVEKFHDTFKGELYAETKSEAEYNANSTDQRSEIYYNYNDNAFYRIDKEKYDNEEQICTMTYKIGEGVYSGNCNIENDVNSWFIEGDYNLQTDEFTCNTQGYKGIVEYCDVLETKMKELLNKVDYYLLESSLIDN